MSDDLIVRGRYQIVPEGGTKPRAHTRITNYAKKLEDGFTLTEWKQRSVLVGAAQRPDIIAATLAAQGDRAELNRLAEAAMEAAKANVAREMGTALHALTEQVDSGMAVNMPSPYKEDLAAYRECMDRLGAKVVRMEEVVVLPELQLAGRFDRLVEVDGQTYVLDLKTGSDLSYSWLSIAIQLALYAQAATIYDHETQTHEPMPAVSQDRAIVVHLPAGMATATAYWIDLYVGRHGIQLVHELLEWRKIKGAAEAIVPLEAVAEAFPGATIAPALETAPVPGPWPADTSGDSKGAPASYDEVQQYVRHRVTAIVEAGHGADLASRWPLGVPTLKSHEMISLDQFDEILEACTLVEGLHRMPFPLVSDPRLRDQQITISKGKKGSK